MRRADRCVQLRHGVLAEEHGTAGDRRRHRLLGRVQLPPEALAAFPDRRVVVSVGDEACT